MTALTEERYERLMLLIFCESISIMIIILFKEYLFLNEIGGLVVLESLAFLQLPFLSFVKNDFLAKRPQLVDKITKVAIKLIIGIMVAIPLIIVFIIDWKAGVVGILLAIVLGIVTNWKKIEEKFDTKNKKET